MKQWYALYVSLNSYSSVSSINMILVIIIVSDNIFPGFYLITCNAGNAGSVNGALLIHWKINIDNCFKKDITIAANAGYFIVCKINPTLNTALIICKVLDIISRIHICWKHRISAHASIHVKNHPYIIPYPFQIYFASNVWNDSMYSFRNSSTCTSHSPCFVVLNCVNFYFPILLSSIFPQVEGLGHAIF